MTIEQFIEAAIADVDEFAQGQPVSIQIDPLVFSSGLKFDLTPDNIDIVLPSGEVIASPFDVTLTLPTLGKVSIAAGTNVVTIQKSP